MSYYFIENRFPERDPNIDLNFGNDILYSDLTGDQLDKYDTSDNVSSNVKPFKNTQKTSLRNNKQQQKSNNTLYVLFLLAVIFLVIIWYIYGMNPDISANPKIKPNVQPELTMMSPDVGIDQRYGILN